MGLPRVVARNVLWTWAGTAVSIIAGFIVAPFLIRHLGQTTYGLWILLTSFVGYFGLLDLGIRGAVGRHIAYYHGRNDSAGVNTILSTALVLLSSAGAIVLAISGVVLLFFFRLFEVAPDEAAGTSLALVLVGATVAMTLVLGVFDALLWACQRTDLLNLVEIPTTAARVGLTFYVIHQGYGLVGLAIVNLVLSTLMELSKIFLAYRIFPQLRLGLGRLRKWAFREVLGFGVWNSAGSMCVTILEQSGAVIIGAVLGVALVTPYAIALKLVSYCYISVGALGNSLAPFAAAAHANDERQRLQRMFLLGGKYSLGLALLFVAPVIILGKSFIALWINPELAESAQPLLVVLALGQTMAMSQIVTCGILGGMGRPRIAASITMIEVTVAIPLALVLVGPYDVLGVCLGFAVAAVACRGIATQIYSCRLIGVSPWTYLKNSVGPALVMAALPIAGLGLLAQWKMPQDWHWLFMEGGAFAVCYLALWALLIRRDRHRSRLENATPDTEEVDKWRKGPLQVITPSWSFLRNDAMSLPNSLAKSGPAEDRSKLVSVIVPTFNRAYCLGRTLDSALAQSHRSLEIIVVDDGSTDATRALVEDYSSRDPRVRYIFQENRGVSAARNRGIRTAQGEYVALLDSDDVWVPWKLQAQVACLDFLPDAGMIWTDMEAVDADGTVFSRKYLRTKYHAYRWFRDEELFARSYPFVEVAPQMGELASGGTLYAGDIYSAMIMGNLVHTSTVLIRRSRLEKVAGFNEEWLSGEDHDYHLRTCREGPVAFLDLATIQYQRGFADHLGRFSFLTAINFLNTITAAIAQDRDRITLPRWMLRQVQAEANAWAGWEYLQEGNRRGARCHLARSLRYKVWQPRTIALLGVACLPRIAGDVARKAYRGLKRQLRRIGPANQVATSAGSGCIPVATAGKGEN
jgi:O-antigen/teichoic acid export membrane protein/GT2 family glycosyltransferase